MTIKIEHKSFHFETSSVDLEQGTFEGYASTFGVVDEYDEVVEPGAFTKTIRERGHRVKICWQHNWDVPIGKPLLMEEHGRDRLPVTLLARAPEATGGLFVKGKISLTTQGTDSLILMRDGVVDELSIGYDEVKSDYSESGDVRLRHLREIRLWEFSPVTWGANHAAVITAVKRLGLPDDVMAELRAFIALPGGIERLAAMLRKARAAEPGQIASLTARARVLEMQLQLAGGIQ
jgi:HK97 family phage prohead protease